MSIACRISKLNGRAMSVEGLIVGRLEEGSWVRLDTDNREPGVMVHLGRYLQPSMDRL